MNKYVVLLRGVNVGGNHRVPKTEFQSVLERLGFRDVVTYINSGNAVVSSDQPVRSEAVQTALEAHFGFSIPTLVLPAAKIMAIAAAIPSEWTNDSPQPGKSGWKSDVIFLFDEINTPDILQALGYRPEVETMLYIDGAVLTTISGQQQQKGSLQKLIGTPLYRLMTVRNITTTKKLAELAK